MSLLRVLIVEDSADDVRLLLRILQKGGYKTVHRCVETEESLKEALRAESWDLVISDHDMPHISVPAALTVLRESGLDLPFIIVSENIGEENAVAAIKAGAHDYIMKDSLIRLIPAIQNELRAAEIRREGRKAEENLRRREQDFKTLAENAPDIVTRFDRDLRHIYINPAIEKEMGISRAEFIGKTHEELNMSRKNIQLWDGALREVFRTGREKVLYSSYPTPTGQKYRHTLIVPEFAQDGSVETVLSITRDITELKQMEAALQREQTKTRLIHRGLIQEKMPAVTGLAISACYQPARELRGDYYNLIGLNSHLLFFYLTDVRGDNMDGVMQSSFVRKSIERLTANGDSSLLFSPATLLHRLANEYEEKYPSPSFSLSILIAVLNSAEGKLYYVSTGFDNAPLTVWGNGELVELPVDETIDGNSVLQAFKYGEHSVNFTPGSTFFFSTDGLMKQRAGSKTYGPRLKEVLLHNYYFPPELIARAVHEDFTRFCGRPQGDDDIAFIIVHRAIKEERHLVLEMENDFAALGGIIEKVLAFLSTHKVVNTDLLDFHELLVNAVEHGNKYDSTKKVFIDLTVTENYYRIEITDQGEGFNWRPRLKNELDLDDFSERGRGIFLTRILADYLGYNERGNRVTLINLLPRKHYLVND